MEREGEHQQPQNKAGASLTAGRGCSLDCSPLRAMRDLQQSPLGLVSIFL